MKKEQLLTEIKVAMVKANIGNGELADKLSQHPGHVSQVLNGHRDPGAEFLRGIVIIFPALRADVLSYWNGRDSLFQEQGKK